MIGEGFEGVDYPRDIMKNASQSMPRVDIGRTTAQCFDDRECRIHLHIRVCWRSETDETDLCIMYERASSKLHFSNRKSACRYTDMRLLDCSDNNRDDLVFVDVVEIVAQPERMPLWTLSMIRLQLLDQCLKFNWQPSDATSGVLVKKIGPVVDRKLGVGIGRVRPGGDLGQFPHKVVKSRSGIVDAIPYDQSPRLLRECLGNRDVQTALRAIHVELIANRIGVTFKKDADLSFKSFQMMIGPVNF